MNGCALVINENTVQIYEEGLAKLYTDNHKLVDELKKSLRNKLRLVDYEVDDGVLSRTQMAHDADDYTSMFSFD